MLTIYYELFGIFIFLICFFLKDISSKIHDALDEISTEDAESFIRWYALNDIRVNIQYSNIYNSISRISVGLFRVE